MKAYNLRKLCFFWKPWTISMTVTADSVNCPNAW